MRDISYYVIISISGPHEELLAQLALLMRTNAHITTQLHRLMPTELFKPLQYPLDPIGPALYFWVDRERLWFIVHPLLKDSVTEVIDSRFTHEVIDSELNIFEIMGPNSTQTIRSVLQPVLETPDEVKDVLSSLPAPGCTYPGFSIAYTASDPRTIDCSDVLAVSRDIDLSNKPELCQSLLFTTRNFPTASEEEFNTERAKLLFPKASGASGAIPIMLMHQFARNNSGFGSGWLLFCPFGFGKIVFGALVAKGVRVFGVECSLLIDLESERFGFPFDRPETNAGLGLLLREISDVSMRNEARPKGKRQELSFYEFPPQFYLSYEDNELAYSRVSILMAKRGTPSRLSTIFAPVKQDYAAFGKIMEIKGKRESIGMVLNGNNSLLCGEGKGLGLVRSQVLMKGLPELERECEFVVKRPKESRLVLIRERGSQFYHIAWVWVHASTFSG
jgi:hypothetical protein